jgi:hypothetical protein
MMHGRTYSHLGSLQIEAARLAALLENHAQQLVYFALDLLADRFRRFFFLWRERFLNWSRPTNLRIHLDEGSTQLAEAIRLEFRAEMFNFTNTPVFAAPGQTFGNAQFGVVSSQSNSPRQVQFGLKLYY